MRGDFSRFTFDPKKHYTGVLLQQGRVQVDADWNEQQAIIAHRLATESRDLIGASGAPVENAGFRIVAAHGLSFDGVDDYVRVDVPRGLSFPGRHPFTLETWVNPALQGGGGTILSKFSSTADDALGQAEYYMEVSPEGTVCFHRVGFTAASGQPAVQSVRSIRPVPFGRYTHIAVVYDGQQGMLYLDGELAGVGPLTLESRETITSVVLGARLAGLPRRDFYHGGVGETRVWSVARSPEQLARCMYDEPAGDEEGLTACWGFDEGAGNMARDRTGRGNDGVFGEAISDQPQRVRPVWLTRGRYYVEGVLCRNDGNLDLAHQPDYPDPVLPPDVPERVSCLAYLDVWERSVTALEDPSIREVALGGPDTAVRSRLVWQVKLLPVDGEAVSQDPGALAQAWERFLWRTGWKATLRARRTRMGSALGNQLYRVEVHNRGGRYGWPRPDDGAVTASSVERLLSQTGQVVVKDWVVDDHAWAVGDLVEVFSHQTDGRNAPGPLARVTALDSTSRALTLYNLPPEMVGHTGLHLRRVAGFKWSRDNGAVAFPVSRVHAESGMVTLQSMGHDLEALKDGDWVEVTDDDSLLLGRPNPLCRVESIDRTHLQVVLSQLPPALADSGSGSGARKGVRLIRWDQARVALEPGGNVAPALDARQVQQWLLRTGVIPACANAWVDLEDGVQVYLEGEGRYEAGDYWLIPSRSLTEDIEWPQGPAGPLARPPHGVAHRYAELALLEIGPRNVTIQDRRQTFTPLTAEYVQRSGDTITGDLSVQGSLHVGGRVTADSLAGALASNSVGTNQLADRSVTPSKLAQAVGTVPVGYSILGGSAAPPPGFAYTGSTVVSVNPQPVWERVSALPAPAGDPSGGPGSGLAAGAALGARIYAVLVDGTLLEYDPESDQWAEKSLLPTFRQDFAIAAGVDRLYVIGGIAKDGARCPLNQAYDPASDSWENRADLPTPRSNLAAASLGGRIYATGGVEPSGRESRAHQVYLPDTDSWETLADLPTARSDLAMGVAGGRLYAVGGARGKFLGIFGETITAENEEYNPAEDRWSSRKAHLSGPVRSLTVASLGNGLYAIGGVGRAGLTSATRRYDPSYDQWQELPPLPEARSHHGMAVLGGELYILGGETGLGASRDVLRASVASTLYVHRKV